MPPPLCSDPLRPVPDGVRVAVRLTPRARANRIDGIVRLADGSAGLKMSVTAPPAGNRANEALLCLLAEAWKLPLRDLSIVGGVRNRNKLIHIAGDPRLLTIRLGGLLAALPRS